MMGSLRAALVIARRDYVASVWSRTFLFFLIGPLLPVLAAGLFGAIGGDIDEAARRPRVAVVAAPAETALIEAARERLSKQIGDALPDLLLIAPSGGRDRQRDALLRDRERPITAVLDGGLDAPRLTGSAAAIGDVRGPLAMLIAQARDARALGADAPAAVTIREAPIRQAAAGSQETGRRFVARVGQLVLMLLTMILAGMLLSNLIEEKSNKVIEVLAAAVPVDAIFFGKLIAMLGMSLTGIAAWGGAVIAVTVAATPDLGAIPVPAVGWPAFLLLGLVYFSACYLLLGALFLGIGAQASTVREVQTLSMPVTMAQLLVVGFASTAVAEMNGSFGIAAAIFPWSSPFAMLARAAQSPTLWPHAAALLWQAVWIALIIRAASRLFRRSVLKSGRRPWWRRRGARSQA